MACAILYQENEVPIFFVYLSRFFCLMNLHRVYIQIIPYYLFIYLHLPIYICVPQQCPQVQVIVRDRYGLCSFRHLNLKIIAQLRINVFQTLLESGLIGLCFHHLFALK